MMMTLYATKKEFTSVAEKYFLAGELTDKTSVDEFFEYYTESGFGCEKNK